MRRLRLRFLLQEFDLKGTQLIIGRSPDCDVSIEDPLMSRQHARIRIEDDHAFLCDMGSRNGVRINGKEIKVETELFEGDRIRLGTQELVFSTVDQGSRAVRTTGHLAVCSACGVPFPGEVTQCPHCGQNIEETVSSVLDGAAPAWTLDLYYDVIGKALKKSRYSDAQYLLAQLSKEMTERFANGENISSETMDLLAGFAVELSVHSGKTLWLAWAVRCYRRYALIPSAEITKKLSELELTSHPEMRLELNSLATWLRQKGTQSDDAQDYRARAADLEEIASRL